MIGSDQRYQGMNANIPIRIGTNDSARYSLSKSNHISKNLKTMRNKHVNSNTPVLQYVKSIAMLCWKC